jgi:quinoprotein glucose dehydrogenase
MPTLSRRSMLYGSATTLACATLASGAHAQGHSANGIGSTANAYPAPPAQGAVAHDTQWTAFAGDNLGLRYSPLDQINAANFKNLQVAWRLDSAHFGPRTENNWESVPLLVKGRLYVTAGARRDLICVDAITGEMIWMYRVDEGKRGADSVRALSGRGASYWTDGKIERIVYVTPGYSMVSLDIATGLPDPKFGVKGTVDLKKNDDQEMDLETATIALQATPLIANNVVIVGAAHTADTSPRDITKGVKGYIRGFDVRTGKRLWVFHTVPRKGEFGYDTWAPGLAEKVNNAGSWTNMCADEQLGLVYVGVELPGGDNVGVYRRNNALFGESLVALSIKTGKRKWHYQMVHHGLWDNDVSSPAMIVDIPVNGQTVKAIAQPTKQSFLYVLNRETGEPIWPIPEMPVPAGDVPAEYYSPTQPIPSKPPAYDRQSVKDDDLVDFTPAIKARAKEIADHYVRGGVYTPPTMANYAGTWGTLYLPGSQGGTNWPGGAFDPETKIVYVYSKTTPQVSGIVHVDNPGIGSEWATGMARAPGAPAGGRRGGGGGGGGAPAGGGDDGEDAPRPARGGGGTSLTGPVMPGNTTVGGLPIVKPPYGRITALDLKDGSLAWQIAHGETPDNIKNHPLLKGLDIPRTGQAGNLGPLVTKTLLICGDAQNTTTAQGVSTSWLRAYDKATGKEIGAVPMEQGQTSPAMTYAIGGWQYIVLCVASAGDRGAQMLAYRLHQV